LRCHAGCSDEFEVTMRRSKYSARKMRVSRWKTLSSTRC